MALFDSSSRSAIDVPMFEPTYHKVVRVLFTPHKESGRVPPRFHANACVRCVEGGGAQWNLLDARDIGHFWAQGKYTCLNLDWPEGVKDQILDESSRQLELRLQAFGFVRVHRRELVNLRYVRQVKVISSPDGARGVLLLQDGTRPLKKHLLHMATPQVARRRSKISSAA